MKACARYKPWACAATILSSYEWWPVPALVGQMCSAEKCSDKTGKGSKQTKAHATLASCRKQLKVYFWTGELQKLQTKPAQGSPRPGYRHKVAGLVPSHWQLHSKRVEYKKCPCTMVWVHGKETPAAKFNRELSVMASFIAPALLWYVKLLSPRDLVNFALSFVVSYANAGTKLSIFFWVCFNESSTLVRLGLKTSFCVVVMQHFFAGIGLCLCELRTVRRLHRMPVPTGFVQPCSMFVLTRQLAREWKECIYAASLVVLEQGFRCCETIDVCACADVCVPVFFLSPSSVSIWWWTRTWSSVFHA